MIELEPSLIEWQLILNINTAFQEIIDLAILDVNCRSLQGHAIDCVVDIAVLQHRLVPGALTREAKAKPRTALAADRAEFDRQSAATSGPQ